MLPGYQQNRHKIRLEGRRRKSKSLPKWSSGKRSQPEHVTLLKDRSKWASAELIKEVEGLFINDFRNSSKNPEVLTRSSVSKSESELNQQPTRLPISLAWPYQSSIKSDYLSNSGNSCASFGSFSIIEYAINEENITTARPVSGTSRPWSITSLEIDYKIESITHHLVAKSHCLGLGYVPSGFVRPKVEELMRLKGKVTEEDIKDKFQWGLNQSQSQAHDKLVEMLFSLLQR